MRAQMLAMLSLTPPAAPAAHHWVHAAALSPRSQERRSMAASLPNLPRPVSLSQLIRRTALFLHP